MAGQTVRQFPPEGVHGAEFNNSPDTLWLDVSPKILDTTSTVSFRGNDPNGKDAITATATGTRYRFLMPTLYSTSQNHEWDKFDTVGSKINEVATEVAHAAHSIAGGFHSNSAKADAPIFYKDSARREWTFEFQFIVHSNAYLDVWLPIQEFLRMAAPTDSGGGINILGQGVGDIGIKIPYLFGLQTVTGTGRSVPVLSVSETVITSVQTKYEQPYIGGYPSKAELTLTFKDLNVLFNSSYKTAAQGSEGVQISIKENGVDIGGLGDL